MDKKARKINRKKQRILALLPRGFQLSVCAEVKKTVLVGNAGLMTGASHESLLARFLPHAPPRRLLMSPGRQFSFLEFENENAARRAVEAVDGKEHEAGILYLSYVDSVPEDFRLCSTSTFLPPDAVLLEDFLSAEEEENILSRLVWDKEGSMKHRQVQHFGYAFDYNTSNVDVTRPLAGGLPDWCQVLTGRLRAAGHLSDVPDQLTVNRYLPGQGIPSHVDTHSAFMDQIVSISLGSDITMEFSRPPDGSLGKLDCPEPPPDVVTSVRLSRRSALIMGGEARYLWSHGIVPRKSDVTRTASGAVTLTPRGTRVSLTLRQVRAGPCRCRHPQQCDSQRQPGSQETPDRNQRPTPRSLEKTYVAEVYERIAGHFSSTRHSPWPRVERFVSALPAGSLLLDVGCGNGKYLGINKALYEVGVDQSRGLCEIAGSRGHQTVTAGCLPLPVRSRSVDACICVAVLHHLASRERRRLAVSEIGRVLRPGGTALIYVWALEQKLGTQTANYIKPSRQQRAGAEPAPETDQSTLPLPVHTNRTVFRQQDLLVPWKLRTGAETLPSSVQHRYYHVYARGELEEDVQNVGTLQVSESYYDQGNWCVVLQKR